MSSPIFCRNMGRSPGRLTDMLTLTGIVRAATTVGGGTSKKTGEVFAKRSVVQIEGLDNRGLVQLYTLTVPDLDT